MIEVHRHKFEMFVRLSKNIYIGEKKIVEDPRKTRQEIVFIYLFLRFRAKGSRKARERCSKDISTRAMSCLKWAAFSHA